MINPISQEMNGVNELNIIYMCTFCPVSFMCDFIAVRGVYQATMHKRIYIRMYSSMQCANLIPSLRYTYTQILYSQICACKHVVHVNAIHVSTMSHFSSSPTSDEGVSIVDATAPDTITTWHGEAVALSKREGIGFSELTPLTVYKPFFVSLELPYSVNYGESVIIKPVLFNFWDNEATVS